MVTIHFLLRKAASTSIECLEVGRTAIVLQDFCGEEERLVAQTWHLIQWIDDAGAGKKPVYGTDAEYEDDPYPASKQYFFAWERVFVNLTKQTLKPPDKKGCSTA